jgi:hypothetical protein
MNRIKACLKDTESNHLYLDQAGSPTLPACYKGEVDSAPPSNVVQTRATQIDLLIDKLCACVRASIGGSKQARPKAQYDSPK